jgi:hypothetical protein
MKTLSLVVLSALGLVVLARSPAAADQKPTSADERLLEKTGLKTDGASLLTFFRQRTLTPVDRALAEDLIQKLGANSFRVREQATARLLERGPVVVELLKKVLEHPPDLEVVIRAEECIKQIQEKDFSSLVLSAAARLVKDRRPEGAVPVLLDYLPFADNESVADEVRRALTVVGQTDAKVDPALVKALSAKDPVVRGSAGEVLANSKDKDVQKSVRRLLKDESPLVRYRVATALILARERTAVPVLIEALPELTQVQAWQAEDLLFRVADGNQPPKTALGSTRPEREKCRDTWLLWWKGHAARVDLAKLHDRPKLLGYTVVVLLERGEVMELGPNNQVRWKVANLQFPLDLQVLPGDRFLVAEYHASKVTERNIKGELLWQYRVVGPLVAQRLPNGNTFIATDKEVFEVDRTGTRISSFSFPSGERIMKASKLPNGEMICLTDNSRVVRLDSNGKELKSFAVMLTKKLFGGRLYTTSNGHVLVPLNNENKVVEYDANGKAVWHLDIDQPVAAVRLPNGNTLVTTYNQNRAVEFDQARNEVWEYQTDTKLTRALRR